MIEMKNRIIKIAIFILVFQVIIPLVISSSSSYEISVNISDINKSNSETHFVIENWEVLPYKDQRALNESWLDYINEQLEPKGADWWTFFTNTSVEKVIVTVF